MPFKIQNSQQAHFITFAAVDWAVVFTRHYTVQGWLTNINDVGTIGADKFAQALSYSSAGKITQQQWKQPGASNTNTLTYSYGYDKANRLTSANFSGSGYSSAAFDLSNVGYDKSGNLTTFIRTNNSGSTGLDGYLSLYTSSGKNQISYIEEQADYEQYDVNYDANGNMIENELNGLEGIDYDWRNLPSILVGSSSTVYYAYDADGNRVLKSTGSSGIETHYVRGADGQTLAVYEEDAIAFHNIAGGIGTYDGSERRYFLKDHLGSVRATVNRDGNVVGHDDYSPFGLVMPGRSSNSANPNDNYKFTGHELDDEAGLTVYHMNARGMDPVLGRMMQIDSRAEKYPGISPYAYVLNSPVNFTDMTGDTVDVDEDLWQPVNDENGNRKTNVDEMTAEEKQRHQFQQMWAEYGDILLELFHKEGAKFRNVNIKFTLSTPSNKGKRWVPGGQVQYRERGVFGWNNSENQTTVSNPMKMDFMVYLNPYQKESAYANTSEHELQHVLIIFKDALTTGNVRHAYHDIRGGVKGQHLLTPYNPDLTPTLQNMLEFDYQKVWGRY